MSLTVQRASSVKAESVLNPLCFTTLSLPPRGAALRERFFLSKLKALRGIVVNRDTKKPVHGILRADVDADGYGRAELYAVGHGRADDERVKRLPRRQHPTTTTAITERNSRREGARHHHRADRTYLYAHPHPHPTSPPPTKDRLPSNLATDGRHYEPPSGM